MGMILSLAACGAAASDVSQPGQSDTAEQPAAEASAAAGTESSVQEESSSSILVVFFSRTGEQYNVGVIEKGNTAIVAEIIAEKTGADVFEILPAEDYYPTTYKELTDVAMQEQREHARPAVAGELPDLTKYDTVFIGAPVWWGDWPMLLYTFFEGTECSGVKLVPFSTHEGSGLSGFDKKLASAYPGCEVLKGLAIRGADTQNDVEGVQKKVDNWLTELGY